MSDIKMDPSQIDQILANLCVNARDAISGVGKITIETRKAILDEAYCADHAGFVPGEYVLLAVSDDGCGIDDEILEKIFEPFFTTKSLGKGTGLGLSTVYGIVKQNNGFINIYSEPGKGTTLTIYLPRHAGQAKETAAESIEEIPAGRGETVLIDDENDIIIALKRELRSEPYKRLFANSGKEAAAIIADQPVHVIVTDMRMPEMNGLELLQFVETHHPQIIRIVLSAWSDADTIIGAVNKGHIFQYVIKPWDERELKIIIHQALDNYILKQEKQFLIDKLEEQNQLLEQRIEQRTQQLLKMSSQAEIGKQASQIVHNLNNPLHALGGALALADLIISQNEPGDLTKVAAKIALARNSVADLQRIISSILQHARDETHFQTGAINLNAIIEQELTFFDLNPFFRKEIEKETHLAANLSTISGNAVQIKQIIDNLISNAVDAMEHSPIKRLTIRTMSGNGMVIIEVSDTGEGIAQQDLPHIFEPDFTTKPPGKGTGLGLASVKTMVEAYSGKIQVQSQKDKGTTFIVQLPARVIEQV